MQIIVGMSIGFVIGLLAGIMIMVLMMSTFRKDLTTEALMSILGQFTVVISLLFGTTWGTSQLLSSVPREDWVRYYLPSAAFVFLLCLFYPTFKLIARFGREIGRGTNDHE
jgi:hypothetical protein